jgi:thymidylate synthase
MHVIRARNVNVAWPQALDLIERAGVRQETRNGPALVVPEPVATVYECPAECVLLDPVRDANPFFHVHEGLFFLAGRDDARWLDQFIGDFSARYAEPDGRLHGSYGHRWRRAFGLAYASPETWAVTDGEPACDQLIEAITQLKANPQSRQVVIQMWMPEADLTQKAWKDRPCNLSVMLRADRGVLDMTVTCRSNDIVWGCYSANACQFGMLLQYLAQMIGIPVGRLTQFSNNWHRYENTVPKCDSASALRNSHQPYPGTAPLVMHPESFDEELGRYLEEPTKDMGAYRNEFLSLTANPLWIANQYRHERQYDKALAYASRAVAPDWRAAAVDWLHRRAAKHAGKES